MYTKAAYGILLALVSLSSCRYKHPLTNVESADLQRFDTSVVAVDSQMLKMILPYSTALAKEMDQIIAYSSAGMEKARPQSHLGNFVCDLILKEDYAVQPDLSFTNFGGLRAPLPAGAITKRHIYELMPFDNQVVLVKLTSDQWKQLLKTSLKNGGEPYGSTVNMQVAYRNPNEFEMVFDGIAVDGYTSFWVAVNDYIYNGGDGYQMLKEADSVIFTGKLIRDVLIRQSDIYTSEKPYKPTIDKRLYKVQE